MHTSSGFPFRRRLRGQSVSGNPGRFTTEHAGPIFKMSILRKGFPQAMGNRKDKIWYWVYDGDRGPNAYTSFLIHTVHQTASTNRTDWRGLYFVPDARILAAELELAHSTHLANAPAREAALNHHVAALQRKLDAAEEENADWLAEVEQAQEIAEFYRNENISLRRQIDVLRNHLKRQRGDKELDTDVPIPRGYDAMPDWVRQHLAGRLILHPRAERAVGKAEYVEPEMVYRALLILANEYRNSRMGIGSDEAFQCFSFTLSEATHVSRATACGSTSSGMRRAIKL